MAGWPMAPALGIPEWAGHPEQTPPWGKLAQEQPSILYLHPQVCWVPAPEPH